MRRFSRLVSSTFIILINSMSLLFDCCRSVVIAVVVLLVRAVCVGVVSVLPRCCHRSFYFLLSSFLFWPFHSFISSICLSLSWLTPTEVTGTFFSFLSFMPSSISFHSLKSIPLTCYPPLFRSDTRNHIQTVSLPLSPSIYLSLLLVLSMFLYCWGCCRCCRLSCCRCWLCCFYVAAAATVSDAVADVAIDGDEMMLLFILISMLMLVLMLVLMSMMT